MMTKSQAARSAALAVESGAKPDVWRVLGGRVHDGDGLRVPIISWATSLAEIRLRPVLLLRPPHPAHPLRGGARVARAHVGNDVVAGRQWSADAPTR